MNWDQLKGEWQTFKGKARENWGQVTADDMNKAAGEREQRDGSIQVRCGRTPEAAKAEVNFWRSGLS